MPADRSQRFTRLFPHMRFGCFGTIVEFTVAVWDSDGRDDPKIQIWREDKAQPGVYHKIDSDVPISNTNPQLCYQSTFNSRSTNGSGIFQCTLQEDFHISVQPGDFLGLEIPPVGTLYHIDDFVIYFKSGGPTSLVFLGRLGSTVNLFTESYNITDDEPQITFLVALGKEFLY